MGTSIKPKYTVLAQWIVCHPTKVRDLGSNPKRGARLLARLPYDKGMPNAVAGNLQCLTVP